MPCRNCGELELEHHEKYTEEWRLYECPECGTIQNVEFSDEGAEPSNVREGGGSGATPMPRIED